jgi:hypothetical protein
MQDVPPRMPVSSIRPGPQYWMGRLEYGEGKEWVDHYRVMIRCGLYIPPIKIDQRHFIVDGHHRYQAHVLEGKTEINTRRAW